MKKIIGLALVGFLAIGLLIIVGCQSTTDTTTTTTATSSTTTTTAAPVLGITNISPYATTGVSVSSVSGVKGFALPSNLELNVTFDYFKLYNGTTWTTISATPVTVNLLDPTAMSTGGATVAMTPPPAGTYSQLGMGVSAIYFSQPGQTNRDILPILQAQSGGSEDWDNMVMPLLPFTYGGSGNFSLNMYMPPSNISGSTYADYFPFEGPVFSFIGGSVSAAASGTLDVTIASGVTAGSFLFVGAFQSFQQQAGPSFAGTLTNNGDGTASGSLPVPAGSWYLMAIESTQPMGVNGPADGSKAYTPGGALPWEGSISPTAVTAGQTSAVPLSYAFTMTSTMGSGGTGQAPTGNSSIQFTLQVSPSAVTLSNSAELMLYAFSSLTDFQGGGAPGYFLGSTSLAAGSFSSTTMTASNLGAGTYVVIGFLDISGSGQPAVGVDYVGAYGGFMSPTVITLGGSDTLDLTGTPIDLTLFSGGP